MSKTSEMEVIIRELRDIVSFINDTSDGKPRDGKVNATSDFSADADDDFMS